MARSRTRRVRLTARRRAPNITGGLRARPPWPPLEPAAVFIGPRRPGWTRWVAQRLKAVCVTSIKGLGIVDLLDDASGDLHCDEAVTSTAATSTAATSTASTSTAATGRSEIGGRLRRAVGRRHGGRCPEAAGRRSWSSTVGVDGQDHPLDRVAEHAVTSAAGGRGVWAPCASPYAVLAHSVVATAAVGRRG